MNSALCFCFRLRLNFDFIKVGCKTSKKTSIFNIDIEWLKNQKKNFKFKMGGLF